MICDGINDSDAFVSHFPEPTRSAMRERYKPHIPVEMYDEGEDGKVRVFRCPLCGRVTES